MTNEFTDNEVNTRLKELDEDHEYEIEKLYKKGEIPDYKNNNILNGNCKSEKNHDDNELNLDFTMELKDEVVVRRIYKHIKYKYIKIEFCGKYEGKNVIISAVNSKNWNTFIESARKMIKLKDIHDEKIIRLITDVLDNNYNLVSGMTTSVTADNDEEKKDIKITYIINKYSQKIPLAETILVDNIPYFIQIVDGKQIYKQEIELSDIKIAPPDRIEHIGREYNFSSFDEVQYFLDLAKDESFDSLFNRVKNELKKYLDLDEDIINILAADIIFTYFQDKLGMTHYILIVGDTNTGKSNILLVFSILGYRAILDVDITPANIYNFGSQLEEGQFILIEDEIDDIDFQDEKKKLYKSSYRIGTKVTRMYDSNSKSLNNERKSPRGTGFFLFCYKMFASEKMPDKIKSKGFLERVIPLKATPGDPPYDISEVVNDAGDEQFKELYEELMNVRKLLLIFRLLNHNDPIPNIKLNIKNRYKQLTKPVIRLFQNTESIDEITSSLSKYLIEKNQEKIDSMDSAILTFIVNLVSKHGETLYNDQIWIELKTKYPNGEIQDKPYSWYIEGYGSVSKNSITKTCETKFGAKLHRDPGSGRGLIFNQKTLNKLVENYSIIEGIKIIEKKEVHDTYDTNDTSTEYPDKNSNDNLTKTVDNMTEITQIKKS